MCVKEFYGFNCGHCSIPMLRQCPLSTSNPHYPVCKFPAERPIFINEFCHPCSRVVWNIKILKEEEEHQARHLRGECMCEFIFEGEDREKRLRTRGGTGKAKSKGKEIIWGERRGEIRPIDRGGLEQTMTDGESGDYGGEQCDADEYEVMGNNMVVPIKENLARKSWDPEAQMAAYEYVGYYIDGAENQGTGPEQSHAVAVGAYGQQGQLPMGQISAGMKWYPQEQQHLQLPLATTFHNDTEGAPRGQRATSEPIGKHGHPGPVAEVEIPVLRQFMAVSSDMMSPELT